MPPPRRPKKLLESLDLRSRGAAARGDALVHHDGLVGHRVGHRGHERERE
jgi:hypothetical protein